MRPETAQQILAAGLHEDARLGHDWQHGCCGLSEVDFAQAERLVEYLEAHGWLPPAPMTSLPTSAPKGDPAAAAESIEDLTDRQWAVWFVVQHFGPQTDEEIEQRYQAGVFGSAGNVLPPQTAQSLRSRRAELVRAGHVVKTAERRPTSNGSTAAVWAAVGEARVAA